MKVVGRLAWRYFKSKKTVQAINLISWISMGAIAIAVAAMIILFSVFNGLDASIKDMYTTFHPEIKITAQKRKFFELSKEKTQELQNISGVEIAAQTIEDMVLLSNEDEQRVAVLKGVDNDWFTVSAIDSYMIIGEANWANANSNRTSAILGLSIANNLSVNVNNPYAELLIYYPRSNASGSLNPQNAFTQIIAKPEGAFHIQHELDNRYLLMPFKAAQDFMESEGKISAIEIKLDNTQSVKKVQKAIEKTLGEDFVVANRFQQNSTLFMVLSSEKWMVYAILLFVLLIASFNLTGSLYMLVLEKKRDITILKSMGMSHSDIRKTFLFNGLLITMVGAAIGLFIGTLVCLGQIYFGWITMPEGFVVTSYPVKIIWNDYLLILATVLVIGLLAGAYPAIRAGKQGLSLREE